MFGWVSIVAIELPTLSVGTPYCPAVTRQRADWLWDNGSMFGRTQRSLEVCEMMWISKTSFFLVFSTIKFMFERSDLSSNFLKRGHACLH